MENIKNSKLIRVNDYLTDPYLSADVKSFLKMLNSPVPPELEKLTPADARKALEDGQALIHVDLSGIAESEKTIETEGYSIKLNIVRPHGVKGKLPVFIFIHGGGWMLGDYPTHKRMVRDLVVLSGYCAVFVNYTRTPEARYPVAIDEIYSAVKWVARNGNEIDVDGENMAIVGNSVGGNMAAVTAIIAKERGGPKIKLQILMWPVTNADLETESYRQFGQQRFLTTPMMKWFFDMYAGPSQRNEIYVSPLKACTDVLRGLPPALIQVAENDVLRDEGEAYGRKLDEAGVRVTTVRYNGVIHDFGLLNGLSMIPATRSLFAHAAAALKKFLG